MFTNDQIIVSDLPTVNSVNYQHLHEKYNYVVGIRLVIISVILIALFFSPYVLQVITNELPIDSTLLLLVGIVGVVLAILISVVTWIGIGKKGYALREQDIIYKTGLISRSQTVIPFNRVQHVGVYESALLRVFNLCTVEFFTAGGALGDLKISGISKEEGERLKAYVIQKIITHKEETVIPSVEQLVEQIKEVVDEQ
ncbi:PH domain-containing protein [Myroides sp. N17-2]|uniref:PH domain-containing protein n=1 Tax=Myroides sp. N17-2 TaxID=2030799 RepID=UPI000EFBE660|nr:PH domain-containing protein [Myroides sp. N17-2]